MGTGPVKNEGFDHMTVVVNDLDGAKEFFGLLGCIERIAVVAHGEAISRYMGIADWEADHVTLVLEGAAGAPGDSAPAVPPSGGGTRRRCRLAGADRLQPCVLPSGRHGRHAGAPRGATASRRAATSWTSTTASLRSLTVLASSSSWRSGQEGPPVGLTRSIDPPGGMAERTNAQLLKSCEVQASVGSNPTPSAQRSSTIA